MNMRATIPMPVRAYKRSVLATIIFAFVLSGCLTQLAPDYDAALVSRLEGLNEAGLTLFASLEQEADAESFDAHADTYASLIGRLQAAELSAASRPAQRPAAWVFIFGQDPETDMERGDLFDPPSPAAIAEITDIVRNMRDRHQSSGLTSAFIDISREQFIGSMDQALTYERALER